MIRIDIKPLSVNEAFCGRRFHTKEHKVWRTAVMFMLPKHIELPEPPYRIYLKFGFSSALSDWDNSIKNFQDLVSEKYGFNDRLIRAGVVETEQVKKGYEYIEFKITNLYDK